ncbi:MAG: hypothetical protein ABI539_14055 [Acidobacteriota bacterium]
MITGFNTDIEYEGVTYHVQTEDKGAKRPIIMTLVYDGGTILASKRQSYEDLLAGELDEAVLAERLQKQHRLICAAVKAGRIDDLRQMTSRDSAAAKRSKTPVSVPTVSGASLPTAVSVPEAELPPIPAPFFDASDIMVIEPDATVFEDAMLYEEIVIPDDAVEIVSEMVGRERPVNNKLSLEFLSEAAFQGGSDTSVGLLVCRGTARKVVASAQIMIKILGSSFRPLIFHASTDANGVAKVDLQLPSFSSGRAALFVRAVSEGEEVELRRAIAHG